ncbi:hypothetical protein COLO4_24286 [Corchorus olitorius]|uniref:Uncharacterized protein n=1 Tax=Corchorus olitorius TaxID=93759 RepID=A0A1R3IBL8_9ROSI|nr:hypothetical protein COLO4_24286 [Corchorus olitorius]
MEKFELNGAKKNCEAAKKRVSPKVRGIRKRIKPKRLDVHLGKRNSSCDLGSTFVLRNSDKKRVKLEEHSEHVKGQTSIVKV